MNSEIPLFLPLSIGVKFLRILTQYEPLFYKHHIDNGLLFKEKKLNKLRTALLHYGVNQNHICIDSNVEILNLFAKSDDDDEIICTICTETLDDINVYSKCPCPCINKYHYKCIRVW